jgi:thioredoxin reductase (NADPH)
VTVDDHVAVSQVFARDLRMRYADRYRVMRATSGAEALTLLEELGRRDDAVAMILSDHRTPETTGIKSV